MVTLLSLEASKYSSVSCASQGLENVLNTIVLVRSCVQSAVGMLRDQTEAGTRSTYRVEILLMLLADKGNLQGET